MTYLEQLWEARREAKQIWRACVKITQAFSCLFLLAFLSGTMTGSNTITTIAFWGEAGVLVFFTGCKTWAVAPVLRSIEAEIREEKKQYF